VRQLCYTRELSKLIATLVVVVVVVASNDEGRMEAFGAVQN